MKRCVKLFSVLIITLCIFSVSVFADTAYKTVTVDKNGEFIETQTAYNPVSTIEKIGDEILSSPSDLVVYGDRMYIADTGNRRIVVSTLNGELISVIAAPELAEPRGLHIADDGQIFVADQSAQAIFCFSQDGKLIQKYERPVSPLYGNKEDFAPLKVATDGKGNLYAVCKGNSNGVVQLSRSTGEFLGYFGANEVTVSLWDKFLDAIFTEEQKSQLQQTIPASISNIAVDGKGIVYTMTDIKTDQVIRKLNMSANNMLKTNISFGNPSDLTIGSIGNIYAVTTNGYILEFNSEGDLLFIFGGFDDGSQRIGLFGTISSIDVSDDGRLFVLDDTSGQIQTFEPTEFTNNVHNTLKLYQEGKYIESKEPWKKVLLMNNLFDYAHKGIAEAYYMEEDYESAMKEFRLSNDKAGYSKAYTEYRNIFLKDNIALILGIFAALVAVIAVLKKLSSKIHLPAAVQGRISSVTNAPLYRQTMFLFKMPKNPIDAYYGIKKEGKASPLSATVWYIVFIIITLADKYCRGYIFSSVKDGRYSVFKDTVLVMGILTLAVLCHYLICSITEGEASLKNVYCGIIYSLMPYIVLRPIVILLTHVLATGEVFIINFLNVIMIACSIALLVVMVIELNNYKFSEAFKCIFWTLFSFFVAIAVLFILYVMCKQTLGFLSELFGEVKYNVQS